MKRIICFFTLILSLFSLNVKAENATTILDKTAAAIKGAGGVKAGFTMAINANTTTGTISILGQKFHCVTGVTSSWFDGKTLWHYIDANEEVNITNPSVNEISRINPYSFLNLYKKGYKCKMGNSNAKVYEVILTGQPGAAFSNIIVRVDKKTYQPVFIRSVTSKTTIEISVTSFLKNQKFSASTFTYDKKKYPNAEVIDLR